MIKDAICWICKERPADSGEHLVKATDLKRIFGAVTQHSPVFKHIDNKNHKIQSIDSKFFKSRSICKPCNNSLTKPMDEAWEEFSIYLMKNKSQLILNKRIKLSNAFSSSKNEKITLMQLYFTKLFGCRIYQEQDGFNLDSFSDAIITRTAHPKIFISIGWWNGLEKKAGITEIMSIKRNENIVMLYWYYIVGQVLVYVSYVESEFNPGNGCWHPDSVGKFISFTAELE